jgi:hypothetical protein
MLASTHRRLAGFLVGVLWAVVAWTSTVPKTKVEGGTVAVVTTVKKVDIRVTAFQLRESPGGQWITTRPNRFAEALPYRIQKDGVTLMRSVPFGEIESIEFTTFVAKDAMYPEVRRMLVRLRNGGSLEWIHADRSVTFTTATGQKERWNSFPWLSGVVSSGEKEQGQAYVITGFTGFADIGGERGAWEAAPTEIKRIRFVDHP